MADSLQWIESVLESSDGLVSVQDVLARWGAKRRGYKVVEEIEREAASLGYSFSPRLVDVPLDGQVKLVEIAAEDDVAEGDEPQLRMKVGWIPTAFCEVVSINSSATFAEAQSLMVAHDYSQLAVFDGQRGRKGAITWESIAQARLRSAEARLADAVDWNVPQIGPEDDLLPLIGRIIEAGFALVVSSDRLVQGIVTTADLSAQFELVAKPFLVIGEVERSLRLLIDSTFEASELESEKDQRDSSRTVGSASDMTLGEQKRLLERPANYERLDTWVPRSVFVDQMTNFVRVRNEVMHFSPDPQDDDDLQAILSFQRLVEEIQGR